MQVNTYIYYFSWRIKLRNSNILVNCQNSLRYAVLAQLPIQLLVREYHWKSFNSSSSGVLLALFRLEKHWTKRTIYIQTNSPFHSSWKVTTLFTWNRGEGWVRTVREVQIIDMPISIFLMIIISTSLTVPTQPSPRFRVEAWLPFRNREMDYRLSRDIKI